MKGLFKIYQTSKIKLEVNLTIEELKDFLNNNLTSLRSGTPNSPGVGFRLIRNIRFHRDILEVEDFRNFSERLIIIEYELEDYRTRKLINNDGNIINFREDSILLRHIRGYIFIIFPDLLIFKGIQEAFEKIWPKFHQIIKDQITIKRDFSFDYEFLLKLIERRWFKRTIIEADYKIVYLRELMIKGDKMNDRSHITMKHPAFILESPFILIAILSGKKPDTCVFDFQIRNQFFTIELKRSGSISFRQEMGDFKKFDDNERAFFGCYLVYRTIEYYEFWETLENKKRLITLEFIKTVRDFCKSQSFPAYEIALGLFKKYVELRGDINDEAKLPKEKS